MPDREKYIEVLSKTVKAVKEFNEDAPIKISLKCVEDILELLEEQEAKWVEDKQGEVCRLIKCSNCGLTFIVGNNIPYDEWIEDKNYCRRCGARMVKRND